MSSGKTGIVPSAIGSIAASLRVTGAKTGRGHQSKKRYGGIAAAHIAPRTLRQKYLGRGAHARFDAVRRDVGTRRW